MTRARPSFLGFLLLLISLLAGSFGAHPALAVQRPAMVLTAFGTSTAAATTYQHIEELMRKRFPGYELRWAFTSKKVREKVRREQGKELKDLPQVLQDLKARGVTRVAVQSLHVVPGEEWEEMVRESQQVPGLQVAVGKPLLSSEADRQRVLAALARNFPADLRTQAVVLVGHGSPHPEGEAAYLAMERLLRSRFAGKNVFLGTVEGKPAADAALAAVKNSKAATVRFVPLLVVAGDHMMNDILGSEPDSWKSRLLAHRRYKIESAPGLGFVDEVVAVFGDHLEEALRQLTP